MKKVLEQEYVHNGASNIYKELWHKIYMDLINEQHGYIKPIGGLWASHFTIDNLSEWLDYLKDNKPDMFQNALDKNNVLIKLKEDAKLLSIINKNDSKNLKDSYLTQKLTKPVTIMDYYNFFTITEIINYEKLSYLYDAIYVSPHADKSLYNYSVRTMLIINPNVIDYFKKINSYYNEEEKRIIVTNIGDKQTIPDISENYIELIDLIKKEFYFYINAINDIKKVKNILKEKYINSKNIIYLIQKNIHKEEIMESILYNLEVDYYKKQKKLLKK